MFELSFEPHKLSPDLTDDQRAQWLEFTQKVGEGTDFPHGRIANTVEEGFEMMRANPQIHAVFMPPVHSPETLAELAQTYRESGKKKLSYKAMAEKHTEVSAILGDFSDQKVQAFYFENMKHPVAEFHLDGISTDFYTFLMSLEKGSARFIDQKHLNISKNDSLKGAPDFCKSLKFGATRRIKTPPLGALSLHRVGVSWHASWPENDRVILGGNITA